MDDDDLTSDDGTRRKHGYHSSDCVTSDLRSDGLGDDELDGDELDGNGLGGDEPGGDELHMGGLGRKRKQGGDELDGNDLVRKKQHGIPREKPSWGLAAQFEPYLAERDRHIFFAVESLEVKVRSTVEDVLDSCMEGSAFRELPKDTWFVHIIRQNSD